MGDPRQHQDASSDAAVQKELTVQYPVNEVLSIVDTRDQLEAVTKALEASGFLKTEITVACGQATADAVKASTGRSGLTDLVIRVATRLGLQNEETETKDRYEQALRDDQFVVGVLAPTDARKELAAQLLATHGAHFINYLGRFTIERLGR